MAHSARLAARALRSASRGQPYQVGYPRHGTVATTAVQGSRGYCSALSRGVGGEKVVAAGLARLLQQVRDIGGPMAAEIGLTRQLEGLLQGVTETEVSEKPSNSSLARSACGHGMRRPQTEYRSGLVTQPPTMNHTRATYIWP